MRRLNIGTVETSSAASLQSFTRVELLHFSLQFIVVHSGIGLLVSFPELLAVFGYSGSYRDTQGKIAVILIYGCLVLTDPFYQILCSSRISIRKNYCEFIAADPRHQVLTPERLLESLSRLFYKSVTLGVSETVVDQLQTIYIRDQDAYWILAAKSYSRHLCVEICPVV